MRRSWMAPMRWKPFRLEWLGRKQGRLNEISGRWLKSAPAEAKKSIGQHFNELKKKIEELLERASGAGPSDAALGCRSHRHHAARNRGGLPGAEHPITRTLERDRFGVCGAGLFGGRGPEVETDFYNFESMNFPPGHPARDTQDTLVIANQERRPLRDRLLLRTHTSPVQMRTMEQQPPPVRIVIPGKVHRNDAADATHSPIFHQVEGLCVDTNITFSDLKGTLDHAMKALFGSSVKTRFFPSFFPFTEPSADVQISCIFCGGKGCRKCKQSGWIELLGCGMVDPAVFALRRGKTAGLRSEEDFRIRLRHGRGADRDDEVRHQRDRAVLCGGYAVFESVCLAELARLRSKQSRRSWRMSKNAALAEI